MAPDVEPEPEPVNEVEVGRPRSAFGGITVVDCSRHPGGALAAMHLAEFGADVIRVDAGRKPAGADLPLWLYANRGKRTVPAGAADVPELVADADVVVVDLPAAELVAAGFDRDALAARNPRLIHAWLPPHAPRGRARDLPADELLLWAWTGVADQQPGATSDHPVAPVVPVVTYEHGALGATAIAAALVARATPGAARALTVSGLHAVAAMNSTIMIDMPGIFRPFGTQKDGTGASPMFRMYRCRDGRWLFLCALTPAFFLRLLEALDLVDLMVMPGIDGDFRRLIDPAVQQTASNLLAQRMATRDSTEWARIFDAGRVPYAPVQARDAWAASETVDANRLLIRSVHPEHGELRVPGLPVELSSTPGTLDSPRPNETRQRDATVAPGRAGGDPRSTDAAPALALDGIVVVDATKYVAGPFGCLVLQDLGATVIKVDPLGGEDFRAIAGASYTALNRDKAQVGLDLAAAPDRQAFCSLVQQADVLVENMSPTVVAALHLDLGGLRAENPGLVHCHIEAWGAGPLQDTPGFDPLLQARSGLMVAQGGIATPVIQAMTVHDIGTGTLAAFGVLAAMYARTHLGAGQVVRTSLSRTSIVFQGAEFTTFAGRPEPPAGCLDYVGDGSDHRLYLCSDGWVAVSARSPATKAGWEQVAAPRPGEVSTTEDDRLTARTVESVLDACRALAVPAVRVLPRDEIYTSDDLAENEFFVTVDDDDLGEVRVVRGFSDWDGVPPRRRGTMRTAGGDTHAVLAARIPRSSE